MSTTSAEGLYACSTILPVLGIAIVSLRFYVRSTQNTVKLKFDDWAQLPALILYIAMAAIIIVGIQNQALGYPSPVTDPPDAAPSTELCEKLWFALQLIQIPTLSLIKIAALRFYRRIFCVTKKEPLYYMCWIVIIIIALWGVGFSLFYILSCDGMNPAVSFGPLANYLKYCKNTLKFEESWAISDMILDTAVLITPIPSIWSLHTSINRKLGITGVFGLAAISYGASIARLASFVMIVESTVATKPADVQTQDTQAAWFSMLEIGLAIIALNMPSIWPLLSSVSIDSVVRSVRSALSLSSFGSRGSRGSRGTRSEASRRWRQIGPSAKTSVATLNKDGERDGSGSGSNGKIEGADDRGVELVPRGVNATVTAEAVATGQVSDAEAGASDGDVDLERGVRVVKTLDVSEERQ